LWKQCTVVAALKSFLSLIEHLSSHQNVCSYVMTHRNVDQQTLAVIRSTAFL
jgi:hypothetical protein